MSNVLAVADVIVKQDEQGRYCLNDLHKAAGGEKRHAPNEFFRLANTKELIEELTGDSRFAPVRSVRGGMKPGTYACKELVYAYAMWISPAFHLKVIRAYDELQTQGIAVAEHAAEDVLSNPLDYFERVLQQAKKLQAERDQLKVERDGVIKTVGQTTQTLSRFARLLPGANSTKIKSDLKRLGYLWRTAGINGTYRVYAQYRDKYFTEKHTEDGRQVDIHVTPEGKALLGHLYEEGKLTMKKGFEK